MNQKQKFFYTLLGAGMLAIGIIIGQIITPGIVARQIFNFCNPLKRAHPRACLGAKLQEMGI